MNVGGPGSPPTNRPNSSFDENDAGPRMAVRFRFLSHAAAFSMSADETSNSRTDSKKPKNPTRSLWYSLCRRFTVAAIRPTGRPRRRARKSTASACWK